MTENRDPTQQQCDPHTLDRERDPRGGAQSEEYRTADPREVVAEDDVAMTGPGGAPQEGKSVEERRRESERWRREHAGLEPEARTGPTS